MQKVSRSEKRSPAPLAPAVGLALNLALVLLKGICGVLFGAPALVSDAVHSGADTLSTAVVLVGILCARKAPDARHPFGHDRFESIAAVILSGFLLAAGLGIGLGGVSDLVSGAYLSTDAPQICAVWVASLSVAVKLSLFLYFRAAAKSAHSTALRADALHQLSDALASLGALVGTALSHYGFRVFDPIASVFISLFLLCAAVGIFRDAAAGLVDCRADEATEAEIRAVLAEVGPEIGTVGTVTRRVGARVDAELTVGLDPSTPLGAVTARCEAIEAEIRARVKGARRVTVTARGAKI